MRHGKRFNHLGRTAPHRKAMLSNMATSLILHKRISTTVAKAKALRKYVEPLITKSKTDTTHSRRVVFSYLQDKESVRELFEEVSDKVNARPGGYTRIIKTGNRLGDNAEMCIIELVDYNELMLEESKPEKKKTRRSRRGGGSTSKKDDATPKTEVKADVAETKEKEAAVEEPKQEEKEETKAKEEKKETPEAKAPEKEENTEASDEEKKEK